VSVLRSDGIFVALRILLMLACLGRSLCGQSIPKGWRPFVSETAGYAVYFPDSWHILPPDLPTLYIVNFPPSQRARAVILPKGGAAIGVVPPPKGVATIEDWVKKDTTRAVVESKDYLTLTRKDSGEPLQVTEVVSRRNDTGEENGGVDCYFEVSGHLFVARLIYWQGNPNVESYRQVLHKIIESLILTDHAKP
jgi:hypothetical protein